MFGFRWVQRFRLPFGFRSSMTRNGLGFSWGIPGLRFGTSPSGRKWISVGFPRLGLYFFRYLGNQNVQNQNRNDHVVSDGDEIFEVNEQRPQFQSCQPKSIRQKSVKWKNIR